MSPEMTETHDAPRPTARDLKALIDAGRAGISFVHWRDGDGEQHILMLPSGAPRVTIGRREQSDIPLTWDAEVSRAHALLEPVGEEWTLVDDGLSRNGSYVNGSRVHGRQRLQDRDRMCFGNTHVVYHGSTAAPESVSTARAPESPATANLSGAQREVLIALCRPIVDGSGTTPATNPHIAAEVFRSVDSVKQHLRVLFDRFGLEELPHNEKRSRLVAIVLSSGVLAPRDF